MRLSLAIGLIMISAVVTSPVSAAPTSGTASTRWSAERANKWYAEQPWLVGSNFAPSTAVNQLEMWQADTFDLPTIDRELGYAQQLGFTSMRVFLHDIPWKEDREGFLSRIDQFLNVAQKHHIGIMFVIFDSVWNPFPKAGAQPTPKPHVHNSEWVQSPGANILKDPAKQDELKDYVTGLLTRFKNDKRVVIWDLYNEPDNPVPQYTKVEIPNKKQAALQLLKKTFAWAREVGPSQPVTSGVWIGNWPDVKKLSAVEKCQLNNSDVITFHNYGKLADVKLCVEHLRRYNRPIICSEYMARPMGSTFDPVLGYFKAQHVGAYNWGFVSGKSQTIYPWDSWDKHYTAEPKTWFHDILRADGSPFDPKEIKYIKSLTGASNTSGTAKAKKTKK